jgi:hypothetical protein
MITTPDRIGAMIEAIERGESPDLNKLATLSSLDLVRAGRRFVEEAVLRDEEADRLLLKEHSNGRFPDGAFTPGAIPSVAS